METKLLIVLLFAFLLVLPNTECGRWSRRRRYAGGKHVASRCYYTMTRNCNYYCVIIAFHIARIKKREYVILVKRQCSKYVLLVYFINQEKDSAVKFVCFLINE